MPSELIAQLNKLMDIVMKNQVQLIEMDSELKSLKSLVMDALLTPPLPKPIGASGTMTPLPLSPKVEGYITPKDEPVNARYEPRVAPETLLYKLDKPAFVNMSTKDAKGFTWYRIAASPFAWVREDVVTFTQTEPAPAPVSVTHLMGKFPAPFTPYSITNRHGVNKHIGVDLATGDHTPAITSAAMNGYVVKTALCGGCGATPGVRVRSNNFGFGNFVIVAYPLLEGGWLHCLYGHLSSIRTMPGATLNDTSIIGNVGSSGDSSGNHLHLQCRLAHVKDERWATLESREVDPVLYFQI